MSEMREQRTDRMPVPTPASPRPPDSRTPPPSSTAADRDEYLNAGLRPLTCAQCAAQV